MQKEQQKYVYCNGCSSRLCGLEEVCWRANNTGYYLALKNLPIGVSNTTPNPKEKNKAAQPCIVEHHCSRSSTFKIGNVHATKGGGTIDCLARDEVYLEGETPNCHPKQWKQTKHSRKADIQEGHYTECPDFVY